MTEIPPAPSSSFCAGCNEQLTWLYSASKEAWVAFIPYPAGRWVIQPHPCRSAQDPTTWRALPHGDPPSAEYIEIKKQIASKETT